jgi:hypothetical protein
MRREGEKAAARAALEQRRRRPVPLKAILLGSLLALNLYLWLGDPEWLRFREPSAPSIDYYQNSWKLAVVLQRQRIEEYRKETGAIPANARQAGQPVHGVQYTPIDRSSTYELAAGAGPSQVVYRSTDSLSTLVGRALVRIGLVTGGAR